MISTLLAMSYRNCDREKYDANTQGSLPVVVRIIGEGKTSHVAIRWLLLERNTLLF
jgi:hypothetical protein